MKEIPYESGSYYVFDRGYNAFKELYKICLNESYFVVRAKKNLQYKCTKWKRRLPKNVLSDSVIELTDVNTQKKFPERLRLVRFHDDEQDRDFAFLTNAFHLTALEIANSVAFYISNYNSFEITKQIEPNVVSLSVYFMSESLVCYVAKFVFIMKKSAYENKIFR